MTHVESLLVNGVQRSVAAGTTVDDMVALIAPDKRGVAGAVNGEVVPKSAWGRTTVGAGDTVDLEIASQRCDEIPLSAANVDHRLRRHEVEHQRHDDLSGLPGNLCPFVIEG